MKLQNAHIVFVEADDPNFFGWWLSYSYEGDTREIQITGKKDMSTEELANTITSEITFAEDASGNIKVRRGTEWKATIKIEDGKVKEWSN